MTAYLLHCVDMMNIVPMGRSWVIVAYFGGIVSALLLWVCLGVSEFTIAYITLKCPAMDTSSFHWVMFKTSGSSENERPWAIILDISSLF